MVRSEIFEETGRGGGGEDWDLGIQMESEGIGEEVAVVAGCPTPTGLKLERGVGSRQRAARWF